MDASTYEAVLDVALLVLGILACALIGIVVLSYYRRSDKDTWPS